MHADSIHSLIYIWRFGLNNPYIDKDYRILAVVFLLIDFFVEIVSDAFKNVLKRGYLDELIATCKHVALVEIITTFFLFTSNDRERMSVSLDALFDLILSNNNKEESTQLARFSSLIYGL